MAADHIVSPERRKRLRARYNETTTVQVTVDLVAQLGGKAKQKRLLVRGVTARLLDRATAINKVVVLKGLVTLQDTRVECSTCSLDVWVNLSRSMCIYMASLFSRLVFRRLSTATSFCISVANAVHL